ncbi:MAG: DNA alkylation repair protein [Fusobacteriales bacterium]|nr:MAG: DNA alkylation repair protein [Fusobacteriales bacterium]
MKKFENLFEELSTKEYENFRKYLFELSEEKFQKFTKKLIPNYENIIGVRSPILKNIAKKISKNYFENYFKNFDEVLKNKKIFYHEEKIIYAYVLANSKEDFKIKLERINKFINLIDNWAICDCACSSFKFIQKNKDEFYSYLISKIKTKNMWEQRFILVSLLDYYIENKYLDDIFKIVEEIKSDEYYVNMAKAWLLSICYIKFKDKTFTYLKNSNLDTWTINKSLQKIRESTRISKEEKNKVLILKR